jgi:hypothetical protein
VPRLQSFVEEQTATDFAVGEPRQGGDPWFIQRIAQIPRGEAADHLTDEDAVRVIHRSLVTPNSNN